jgi:hypothetical protein
MIRLLLTLVLTLTISSVTICQDVIPFDTTNWDIKAKAYVLENYKGYDAVYIQQGTATLRNKEFLNGTIEFDVFLTERQAFPGVYFRAFDENNSESFYLRPHLSGKPDANQAAPLINGISAWQLYFGPTYSFPYEYNFKDWTHIKLVVNGNKAQVFLDYSEKPNLSWYLKQEPRRGEVAVGGSFAPMHYANFKINEEEYELKNFDVKESEMIEGIIQHWEVSDKFEENLLDDHINILKLVEDRIWGKTITVEENGAANISTAVTRFGTEGNTVFAKITITSDKDQVKLFEFGYSDRVVIVINGSPVYRGTNKWRTRDYRYLGTVGLFDAAYLTLKKGKNELLLAVSEDFGGWGVTGRFKSYDGIQIEDINN